MARRTHGEGTVYKVRDGYYRAQVVLDGRRVGATGRTSDEARRGLAEKVKAHEQGVIDPARSGLLGEYLLAWVQEVKHKGKPSAWRRHENAVRCHLEPILGHLKIGELRREHLTDLHRRLRAGSKGRRRQSDTSINHIHATLRVALEAAVSEGLAPRNVARGYAPPRMVHRDKVVLDADMSNKLLEAAEGSPFEALFVLALTTGMRQGELLALRWKDIDFAAGRITVNGSVSKDYDGTLRIGLPKTRAGRRTFRLPDRAKDALAAHRARQRPGSVLVFPDSKGRLVYGQTLLQGYFYPVLDKAGLPRMRFHDLRHTAATLLLQAGVPAHAVSRMLGHSTVGITLSIYGHVTEAMDDQAARTMDRLLAPSSSPVVIDALPGPSAG